MALHQHQSAAGTGVDRRRAGATLALESSDAKLPLAVIPQLADLDLAIAGVADGGLCPPAPTAAIRRLHVVGFHAQAAAVAIAARAGGDRGAMFQWHAPDQENIAGAVHEVAVGTQAEVAVAGQDA